MLGLEEVFDPEVFNKIVKVCECRQCQCHKSKEPENAEGDKLVCSTHSVTLTVHIYHYQLVPPQFHIAETN